MAFEHSPGRKTILGGPPPKGRTTDAGWSPGTRTRTTAAGVGVAVAVAVAVGVGVGVEVDVAFAVAFGVAVAVDAEIAAAVGSLRAAATPRPIAIPAHTTAIKGTCLIPPTSVGPRNL